MMYWTDWGANPKIERAAMDGSARQVIVTGNITWPNGLTIDKATNRLFWVDAKLDKIEVSDLSGGNRQLIMSSTANIHPYGLAMYQNMLYWTDWNTKSVSRFNLSSGHQQIIVTGLQKPMDIHVFDSSLRFSGSHLCSKNNGGCSDLCLLKPQGYQCACPTGITLKSDGKTCDYGENHNLLIAWCSR
ncbi:PREDICTED: low-density lipoprotein receptor-related protein 4-like [Acropora digitifera]|uniref:low-density lipoprotein receptor-related protein 4-like n=1 Tax=Acropora digitifera TaxID=70779 RepID=UPI00077A2EBE|nr:PREDICTED: low-density lipoprotein receptor-related protein 4-like [Acropora digitifera]